MDDHHVWCGSCILGDDGRFHLFASVWPNDIPFIPNWVTNSRVVRAVSDTPEGPYTYAGEVLGPTDDSRWDARMAHNPTIHRAPDGKYLLFYTGTTYDFNPPTADNPEPVEDMFHLARKNQRIGLATADSPQGPWSRRDAPILDTNPKPGSWDGFLTTNPAPCVMPDDSVYLAYKSIAHREDLLRYGIAYADHYEGPYRRLRDSPIFDFGEVNGQPQHVEDAYVWHDCDRFQLIMKDMNGGICGERHAGIHATSDNAIDWAVSDPPLAYSRRVTWDDHSVTTQGHLERPQLLFAAPNHREPTHLFFATCNDERGWNHATKFWNVCVPLKRSKLEADS